MVQLVARMRGKLWTVIKKSPFGLEALHNANSSNEPPDLYTTQATASEVRTSVVTERPSACLHKLLPRGHQSGDWRKPPMKDDFNLIKICPTNPIQVLNLHGVFRNLLVSFERYFWHK